MFNVHDLFYKLTGLSAGANFDTLGDIDTCAMLYRLANNYCHSCTVLDHHLIYHSNTVKLINPKPIISLDLDIIGIRDGATIHVLFQMNRDPFGRIWFRLDDVERFRLSCWTKKLPPN